MKIKTTRKKLKLSQTEMGVLLGLTRQAVGKIETGLEGRSETKGHIAGLAALEILYENNLLEELKKRIKSTD